MATNDFKPFATGNGANVTSQADYEALAALNTGFSSGKASSAQINKALRQSTFIASALAQFVSNALSADVNDDGDQATFVSNLISAMNSSLAGRLLNIQVFSSSGTWTKTSGANKARVKIWGGGGGGGNSGGTAPVAAASGSGGGYAEGWFDISAIDSLPVTIGAGGAKVAANTTASGGDGGNSSFGSLISATGGGGGLISGAGTAGGTGTGGTILNFTGQGGQGAVSTSLGGTGGGSYGSYGGLGHSSGDGGDGGFPGGGGAGGAKPATSTYFASGKGANGYGIIEEYA